MSMLFLFNCLFQWGLGISHNFVFMGCEMQCIKFVIARICSVKMYDSSGLCRNPSV